MEDLLSDLRWSELRSAALARDSGRCTVSRLLGGECSESLHVHHIESREERPDLGLDLDNLATVCSRHHPTWEALRRQIVQARERALLAVTTGGRRRCPHFHPTAEGRRVCERRLNRDGSSHVAERRRQFARA